jgi:hypothetical protein
VADRLRQFGLAMAGLRPYRSSAGILSEDLWLNAEDGLYAMVGWGLLFFGGSIVLILLAWATSSVRDVSHVITAVWAFITRTAGTGFVVHMFRSTTAVTVWKRGGGSHAAAVERLTRALPAYLALQFVVGAFWLFLLWPLIWR